MPTKRIPLAAVDPSVYQLRSPRIDSLSYQSGFSAPTAGNAVVTVYGSNFINGVSVVVNRTTVGSVSLLSSTAISFIAPPVGSAGVYDFYVVNPNGATGQYPIGIYYTGDPSAVSYVLSTNSATSTAEGATFTISLSTTNVAINTQVPYTITGVSTDDVSGASLSGYFTIAGSNLFGTASTSFTVSADQLAEGTETFTITLNGITPTVSASINILDTSLPPPTYALSSGGITSVNEGGTFTITLTTTNLYTGTAVPYTITGVSSADINDASLTGNFNVLNNSASLVVNITADNLTEGTETFTITLNGISPTVSRSVTIVDTSTTVYTAALSSNVSTVNEGGSFTITLTSNRDNGYVFPYTITGVSSADIGGASLTGNFTVSGGTDVVTFNVTADALTEGTETFTLTLNGLGVSRSVTIVDTSTNPSYALSTSASTVNEGDTFTITLTTTNVANGTYIPYTITGVSSADINNAALSSSFAVSSNTASVVFTVTADTLTEGTETFTITLNDITPTVTRSVTIVDSSITPSYSVSSSVASINEGSSFTVTLTTAGVNVGTLVPYTITGISSADIGGASLTGNFTVTGTYLSGTASLSVSVTADSTTEGTETFTLTLDGLSLSTSVTINDTSISGAITATGGSISYSGGYTYHTFTSSGTFTVSSNPNSRTYDVLIVGGGASGSSTFNNYAGGGGGGGQVLEYFNQTGITRTVTVGGGGGGGFRSGAGAGGGSSSVSGIGTAAGGSAGSDQGAGGTSGSGYGGGAYAGSNGQRNAGGGGGAGGAGGDPNSFGYPPGNGGSGGAGVTSTITGQTYGGGGGGGTRVPGGYYAPGGSGGGGRGGGSNGSGIAGQNPAGGDATYYGGAGGGVGYDASSSRYTGAGSGGIVVFKYLTN